MPNDAVSRRDFARVLGVASALAAAPRFALAAPPAAPILKLNSNENPYGPSDAAMRAMRELAGQAGRYPDEQEEALAKDLAALHGVSVEEILLGIGSSDILRLACSAFLGPGRTAVTADPSFEIVALHGTAFGATIRRVPLTATYAHDLEKMGDGALVYVCNPNNPTATITPKAALRAFLAAVPESTIVIVDEAYHHYATSNDYESVIPLVASHPNLLVARTFSKVYALAGLRLGYAVAQKALIETLGRQQQFNVSNIMALAAARASVADAAHVNATRKKNSDTRAWVTKELDGMGLRYLPSEANFMMIDIGTDIGPLRQAMRERTIAVGRRFPAMPNHLRITIGTPEEMKRFMTALRDVMGKGGTA